MTSGCAARSPKASKPFLNRITEPAADLARSSRGASGEAAGDVRADIVVATNLGRNAVAGRLLGSVAERLPLGTGLPVLLERVGREGERWSRVGSESPFTRILLGVDLTEDLAGLLGRISGLPGVRSVRLVHVAPDDAGRKEAEVLLRRPVPAVATAVEVDAVAAVGRDPADVLLTEARKADATAVAVGACRHGMLRRGVLGSVARRVASDADRAVLLLPPA